MSLPKPTSITDMLFVSQALQQNLVALHDTLARIGKNNKDASLQPLIVDGLSRCAMLRHHIDRMNAGQSGPEPVVDAQVFQRLMALAGPATAIELLDQLLIDLDDAHNSIAAAGPMQDWAKVREKCHVLIAVAGSIGASTVQAHSEQLHAAATQGDATTAIRLTADLHHKLLALISFVQNERLARSA